MKVIISDYQHNPDFIIHARKTIMKNLSMDINGPGKDPLPYGIYFYGYEKGEKEPSGLGELFFYSQRFNNFEESDYSKASDLSKYGSITDFSHFRSIFIAGGHKKGALYYHITTGVGYIANKLGSKILTAGTLTTKIEIVEQFKKSELEPVGEFMLDGNSHTLMLGNTDKFLQKFMNERTMGILEYNEEFLWNIRKRKAENIK